MKPSIAAQEFETPSGMVVRRCGELIDARQAVHMLTDELDTYPGVVFGSNFEFPNRYTRWTRGFSRPPLTIVGRGRELDITAASERGEVLVAAVTDALSTVDAVEIRERGPRSLTASIRPAMTPFVEEERSKQFSVFSALRELRGRFALPEDPYLGFYGAFGYDLAFQFENIEQRLTRDSEQPDLVLYLPDELVIVDHAQGEAYRLRYDFDYRGHTTVGLARHRAVPPTAETSQWVPAAESVGTPEPGAFAELVTTAKESFRRGDLFEVVLTQTLTAACPEPPSAVFRRLQEQNPAPFGGLLNLGRGEFLVSGSPEMYVRVTGQRVETCPISGTIRRGADAVGDAEMVRQLLNSVKDESELTMCTDVDRNDKSRICEPGSVAVIGRRQIETYSTLIHTVDHIEGQLRPGFDAIDAFLTHMWAVTVTGAPKLWAMRFIEEHEDSPRVWYGGAIGYLGLDGDLNTGLTLRTVRIVHGAAEVRVGGTLLADSDPVEEEREVQLKATAFLGALTPKPTPTLSPKAMEASGDVSSDAATPRVLLVDCEDSFVHTLANYLRQVGARVRTVRAPLTPEALSEQVTDYRPTLLLLSPGPGRPVDFSLDRTIAAAISQGLPIFGVCLGLQAIAEHFGGQLDLLDYPMHGKPSVVTVVPEQRRESLFANGPTSFTVGRYHSTYVPADGVPPELLVTAVSDDGVVMAVEHRALPIAGVQFHPESIMSAQDDTGLELIRRVVRQLSATESPVPR
jgi:anthranilate synthase